MSEGGKAIKVQERGKGEGEGRQKGGKGDGEFEKNVEVHKDDVLFILMNSDFTCNLQLT